MSLYYRLEEHYARTNYPNRQIPIRANTTNEYQQRNFLYRSNDVIELKIPVDYLVSTLAILGLYFLRTKNFNLGTLLPLLATNDWNTDDFIKQAMDIFSSPSKEGKTAS